MRSISPSWPAARELVVAPRVDHHARRTGVEQQLAEQLEAARERREVVRPRPEVDAGPAGQRADDAAVARGPDQHADRHQMVVALHVLEVLLEPAGHVERLRHRRVEPRLEHEAGLARDPEVRDLQAVVGPERLAFEVGRERRAHVAGEPLADRQSAAGAAAQQQVAGGDRSRGEHVRARPHGDAAPVGELGAQVGHALAAARSWSRSARPRSRRRCGRDRGSRAAPTGSAVSSIDSFLPHLQPMLQ